jgi:hypothetical protein
MKRNLVEALTEVSRGVGSLEPHPYFLSQFDFLSCHYYDINTVTQPVASTLLKRELLFIDNLVEAFIE